MSQYLESAKQSVPAVPTREELQNGLNNTLQSAQQSVNELKTNVNSTLNEFSSTNTMNASTEFLNSNIIVAKFGFLLLLLIAFMGLLKVGMMVIAFIMSPNKQPYLVKGTLSGNVPVTIRQDPANTDSAVIYRSNNQSGGIEFTWTIWLYIDSLPTSSDKALHVFNKGNKEYAEGSVKNGIATVNNAPGLYINKSSDASTGAIKFLMDTLKLANGGSPQEPIDITIKNIPIQKWFHLALRLKNYNLDCYMNGMLQKSVPFNNNVPKQNYDDVHIHQNGGFGGKTSNLRYYDYALSANDISAIVNFGPNLTSSSLESKPNNTYDYLALGWYSAFQ